MTVVNGDLVNVLGVKQDGIVRIASSLTRPDGSQVIVDDWDEVYVKAGKFTVNVAGGPARFHVVAGSTSKVFNVVVPKTGTVSFAALLEDVVEWSPEIVSRAAMEARAAAKSAKEAAKSASDAKAGADRVGTAEQVGKWASGAKSNADAASKSASAAAGSASAAKTDAGKAASSATNADKSATAASDAASRAAASESAAKTSASNADKSATAAKTSETNAGKSASTASTHATNAGKSATTAKTEADRAANIASSTSWDGDRLTVNGKTSPSLTGPKGATGSRGPRGYKGDKGDPGPRGLKGDKGDTGEKGTSGASTWDAVTGKPGAFPPERHKHKVADITDLPEISDTPTRGTLVQRSPRGTIRCNSPEGPNNAANKAYVDRAVWDKADKSYVDSQDAEVRAFAQTRPAFFSGAGSPPSTIPGAVVGDYYLDETTMELHKITGV